MSELKQCPFCGSEDIEICRVGTKRQSCVVECLNCGCRLESNENGSGRFWNTRQPTDTDVLREALEKIWKMSSNRPGVRCIIDKALNSTETQEEGGA